jgi:hypothetical protein
MIIICERCEEFFDTNIAEIVEYENGTAYYVCTECGAEYNVDDYEDEVAV